MKEKELIQTAMVNTKTRLCKLVNTLAKERDQALAANNETAFHLVDFEVCLLCTMIDDLDNVNSADINNAVSIVQKKLAQPFKKDDLCNCC